MKKYLFILLALVLAVSCNDEAFLEEKTYNDDTGSFFKNQQAIEIALASAYSNIQYMVFGNQRGGSEHNWMLNGMGLDSFTMTSANAQFSNWSTLTPDSGYARHYGDYMYKLANRANTVVDMIDEHPEIEYADANIKENLRAEAVFLRAWAYRVLAGMFGSLVYADHMTTEATYGYEMISREEGWEKIAADFEYAEQNLPTKPRLMGTVTKAAAAHYLSETYLCLGKFKEAEDAASRVINGQDGDYHLMTTRFGNRADQATDRYGNSLAAPQGAYWDLFPTPTPMTPTTRRPSGSPRSTTPPVLTTGLSVVPVTPGGVCTFPSSSPLGPPGSLWAERMVPVLTPTVRSSMSSPPMPPASPLVWSPPVPVLPPLIFLRLRAVSSLTTSQPVWTPSLAALRVTVPRLPSVCTPPSSSCVLPVMSSVPTGMTPTTSVEVRL